MFSELTNCCNATHPCNIGQGDCDKDEDCLGNLVCGRQNCGPDFFWNSTDCCTTLVGMLSLLLNLLINQRRVPRKITIMLIKEKNILIFVFFNYRFCSPGTIFTNKDFQR